MVSGFVDIAVFNLFIGVKILRPRVYKPVAFFEERKYFSDYLQVTDILPFSIVITFPPVIVSAL